MNCHVLGGRLCAVPGGAGMNRRAVARLGLIASVIWWAAGIFMPGPTQCFCPGAPLTQESPTAIEGCGYPVEEAIAPGAPCVPYTINPTPTVSWLVFGIISV